MPSSKNGLEANQCGVDVFGGEKISIRLGFCICGVEFSDAPLPSESNGSVKVLRSMVQLEYDSQENGELWHDSNYYLVKVSTRR